MKSIIWTDYFFKKRKKNLADALKKVSLFKELDKKHLRQIAKICHIRKYEDSEVLFKKNDPSYGLFIVLKGEVEIFLQDKGKKLKLANYHEFEHFGEFSLLDKNVRKASGMAVGDTVLCYIFKEDLKKVFKETPELGISVYKKIIDFLIEKLEYADELMMENAKNTK